MSRFGGRIAEVQITIAIKAARKELTEFTRLFLGQLPVGLGVVNPGFHLGHDRRGMMAKFPEDIRQLISKIQLDFKRPGGSDADFRNMSISHQVMIGAQNFLIGAREKDANEIGRTIKGMKGKRRKLIFCPDESAYFAIGIAGNVTQDCFGRRSLVQFVDRHDRKKLTDSPVIGQRAEQREITVINLGQLNLKILQLQRKVLQIHHQAADLATDLSIESLRHGTIRKR